MIFTPKLAIEGMATVYILYSCKIDKYYIGSCDNFEERFEEHLDGKYSGSFTSRSSDWIVYLRIDGLGYQQARQIERHIKSMKSRVYIQNLLIFPDILEKLKLKYTSATS